MLKYLFDLVGDIKEAVERDNWNALHCACDAVVSELQRLDRRDFRPEAQADFLRLVSVLKRWVCNVGGLDHQKEWEELEPVIVRVLNAYAGEGSLGDPNFLKRQAAIAAPSTRVPPELTKSLPRFLQDHPDPNRSAFIMMQFGKTRIHDEIAATIRATLASFGLEGLRADDKDYHDDLFSNVLTYIHGCAFGVAVFERLEGDEFNPNVGLEVGYMRAMSKPICLLKDQTLKTLPTDLVGKLYKSFDPQNAATSIPPQVEKWLKDRGMIRA